MKFPIVTGLIEREEQDKILNLALLTKNHVLFKGDPGTAKSLQADLFFKNFGGSLFKAQLTKFSTEEVLFGPVNIADLREGKYSYSYDGSILTANFAFIDEIFDASDVLLRSLLGVLNERQFDKGSFHVKCPLHMAVATANYSRANEITAAVSDRFLFQYDVKRVSKNKIPLLIGFTPKWPVASISMDELDSLVKRVSKVSLPQEVMDTYANIVEDLGFSDRRTAAVVDVLKANAFLQNRKTVDFSDFEILRYVTTRDTGDVDSKISKIRQSINEKVSYGKQMKDIDDFLEKWGSVPESDDGTNVEHILAEIEILKSAVTMSTSNDATEERKDRMLTAFKSHIREAIREYLRKQGMDVSYAL